MCVDSPHPLLSSMKPPGTCWGLTQVKERFEKHYCIIWTSKGVAHWNGDQALMPKKIGLSFRLWGPWVPGAQSSGSGQLSLLREDARDLSEATHLCPCESRCQASFSFIQISGGREER